MYRQPSSRSRARQPGRARAHRAGLVPAGRADPRRREQVADRVGQHGRHRAEHPDRRAAERRADHGGGPGGGLEPAVRDEQILGPHEVFRYAPLAALKAILAAATITDTTSSWAKLSRPSANAMGTLNSAANRVRSIADHHRPLAAELHPGAERHRDRRPGGQPGRGQRRHLGRSGMQHPDRDHRERAEPEPGAVRADRVRRPQPPELPPQRPPSHVVHALAVC